MTDRFRFLLEEPNPALELSQAFVRAGHEIYLVGGSVRDALLGRPQEDFDFATDARPREIEAVLRAVADTVFTVGADFGTVGAVKDGVRFEVTTYRKDVYREESRKPKVEFSDDIETDLSRRDFTVNAIAVRLFPELEVVDPFGGMSDLDTKVLRTPLGPEISFSDDPLRMLRLFRFMATLEFSPSSKALSAVHTMHDRLSIISAERIRDELSKLMTARKPGPSLAAMVATGLADEFLPEVAFLRSAKDPLHRHKDVLEHTLAVVDKCPGGEGRLRLRLAALLHDIGKPDTRAFTAKGVTFHHHEVVGARLARTRLVALRYPKDVVEDVTRLVFLHLRPHTFKMGWTDSAVRRYVRDAGPLLEDLNALVRCDVTTRNAARARAIQQRIDELEERISELREREELSAMRPPIDGNDVMTLLGIEPGPKVGEVMRLLTEYRIDHGPFTREEAFELVKEWAAREGI